MATSWNGNACKENSFGSFVLRLDDIVQCSVDSLNRGTGVVNLCDIG